MFVVPPSKFYAYKFCIFLEFILILCQDLFDRIEKEMETLNFRGSDSTSLAINLLPNKDSKHGHEDGSNLSEPNKSGNQSGTTKLASEKGSKKKKGKSIGNIKTGDADTDPDLEESGATKSKKKPRKGKDSSASQVSDSNSGVKKDSDRIKDDIPGILSEELLIQKIRSMIPELEEQG